jgi:hypothetical protein
MKNEPVPSSQLSDEETKENVDALPEKGVDEDDAGVPDGGWRAWSTVIGVLLLQFSTYGYTNAHGVYTDFYVREYLTDYSSSSISWIGGMQFALSFLIGPISGPLFDAGHLYVRHSSNHISSNITTDVLFSKLMCYCGCTMFSFCLFMLSLAKPNQFYQIFLTQGVGVGLSIGITYIPGMGVVSQHFQRHRAIAMGIATSGSALGGLIHPIVVNQLLQTRLGFAGTVKVSAGLVTFTMIVATILIQPRYPKNKELKRKPVNLGTNIRTFFKEPAFAFASLGTFTALLGMYFPIFFLQLNAIKRGLDPSFAFYTVNTITPASLILLTHIISYFPLIDQYPQRRKLLRTNPTQSTRSQIRCIQRHDLSHVLLRSFDVRSGRCD